MKKIISILKKIFFPNGGAGITKEKKSKSKEK